MFIQIIRRIEERKKINHFHAYLPAQTFSAELQW